MLSLWSLSQSPAVNPTEHRTMNQELGRRQPRIPVVYGGEDVNKNYWRVFYAPHPCSDHFLAAHYDGSMFPASGWWDIDDQWDWIEECW